MTTATATRTRKPRSPQPRSATLTTMTHGKLCLWLAIGDTIGSYTLTPLPSDFGTAYRLGKATADGCSEEYDVLLAGRESSCTCKGNTFRGHCKHVEALQALIQSGKLAGPAPSGKRRAKSSLMIFDLTL